MFFTLCCIAIDYRPKIVRHVKYGGVFFLNISTGFVDRSLKKIYIAELIFMRRQLTQHVFNKLI
jgi:hypothetical protein